MQSDVGYAIKMSFNIFKKILVQYLVILNLVLKLIFLAPYGLDIFF